ncbi:hypothetical protein ACJX0J_010800, partial [Zea mays]
WTARLPLVAITNEEERYLFCHPRMNLFIGIPLFSDQYLIGWLLRIKGTCFSHDLGFYFSHDLGFYPHQISRFFEHVWLLRFSHDLGFYFSHDLGFYFSHDLGFYPHQISRFFGHVWLLRKKIFRENMNPMVLGEILCVPYKFVIIIQVMISIFTFIARNSLKRKIASSKHLFLKNPRRTM